MPRAAAGSRVAFRDVFPNAWDVVTTFQGRRYALIDRYELDRRAGERPIQVEVVDLTDGASLGTVEVEPGRRTKAKQRPAPGLAQRIVQQVRGDVERRPARSGRAGPRAGT